MLNIRRSNRWFSAADLSITATNTIIVYDVPGSRFPSISFARRITTTNASYVITSGDDIVICGVGGLR
jgi:hypothetical protein